MSYRTAAFLSILLLSACSPGDDDAPPPKLFEDQRQALDKAKEVNSIQLDAAEKQRKDIEQQSQ
ncbi:MAG: hypothetical protein HZB95_01260 [Nitrosomonadales bacterium]|nr:hypothetical protein [Nitrosomonadales bacterium]